MGQIDDQIQDSNIASIYSFNSNKLLRIQYNMKNCIKRLKNPDHMSRE